MSEPVKDLNETKEQYEKVSEYTVEDTNNTESKESSVNSEFEDSVADESDADIEKEAEEFRLSSDFRENVIRYINFDDLIKKKSEEIKELRKLKKPCEEFIIDYLDEININHIDISDGKIIKNKSETKVPITKDVFKNALGEKIEDPKLISDIIKIIDSRPKKVSVNIKRTKKRNKK